MILRAKGIHKTYTSDGVQTQVLRGVDMEIKSGEFVTIMGKSGSGKSTFLNILSTLDTPTAGEVYYADKDLTKLKDAEAALLRKDEFGFVFQHARMVKHLNLLDNILLPCNLYQKDKAKAIERAKYLMRRMDVETLGEKKYTQVSGGQLQRIGICRALINQPNLLFADEPTGALDSKSGSDVMTLLEEWNKDGLTIVLVTHDIQVAARSGRCVLMKDGVLYRDLPMGASMEENIAFLIKNMQQI